MTDLADQTTLHTRPTGDHAVNLAVQASGLVDERWVSRMGRVLTGARAGTHAVIDLTDAVLVTRRPMVEMVDRLVESVGPTGSVTVVAPRVSALLLLARWGITDGAREGAIAVRGSFELH